MAGRVRSPWALPHSALWWWHLLMWRLSKRTSCPRGINKALLERGSRFPISLKDFKRSRMATAPTHLKLKLQILCGDAIAMGPGKADLLDAIAAEGSISGAGRRLGMSYRRAWQLVDLMNRCWSAPLVETSPGSARGGGARLTAEGIAVLAAYRALQDVLEARAAGPELAALEARLRSRPLRSQAERQDTVAED